MSEPIGLCSRCGRPVDDGSAVARLLRQHDSFGECVEALLERTAVLEGAIRKHRDQRGDDRCWLDDLELYAHLPDAAGPEALALPPRDVFLANCARYHEARQAPGTEPADGPLGRWCTREEVGLIAAGRLTREKPAE